MVQKITLPNGVRIVSERIEHVRSACVGIWVRGGARSEPAELNGITHFIEHMLFKGAGGRTADQIAEVIDGIGGQINAFTTKECVCFYAKSLDIHLKTAAEILADMYLDPALDEGDVAKERSVIFEEIDMYEDTPDDLVTELLSEGVFAACPLGMPVLGTRDTLEGMTGGMMREYMRGRFCAGSLVIALSGSFDDSVIEYLSERFGALPETNSAPWEKSKYKPAMVTRRKSIEQNHVCLGFPSWPTRSDKRHAMALLNLITGGGMSSRLFQRVREREGLCYGIYSFNSANDDSGVFGVYAATGGETESRMIEIILDELSRIRCDGFEPRELERAREQVKANILMGLESTNARMNYLARNEMVFGRHILHDEVIAKYDAVTLDRLNSLAAELLVFSKMSLAAVGKVKTKAAYRDMIGYKNSETT